MEALLSLFCLAGISYIFGHGFIVLNQVTGEFKDRVLVAFLLLMENTAVLFKAAFIYRAKVRLNLSNHFAQSLEHISRKNQIIIILFQVIKDPRASIVNYSLTK